MEPQREHEAKLLFGRHWNRRERIIEKIIKHEGEEKNLLAFVKSRKVRPVSAGTWLIAVRMVVVWSLGMVRRIMLADCKLWSLSCISIQLFSVITKKTTIKKKIILENIWEERNSLGSA